MTNGWGYVSSDIIIYNNMSKICVFIITGLTIWCLIVYITNIVLSTMIKKKLQNSRQDTIHKLIKFESTPYIRGLKKGFHPLMNRRRCRRTFIGHVVSRYNNLTF